MYFTQLKGYVNGVYVACSASLPQWLENPFFRRLCTAEQLPIQKMASEAIFSMKFFSIKCVQMRKNDSKSVFECIGTLRDRFNTFWNDLDRFKKIKKKSSQRHFLRGFCKVLLRF